MRSAARLLTLLAAFLYCSACRYLERPPRNPPAASIPASAPLPADALVPSPRLVVGRVLAVDAARAFAIVDLASDPPPAALADGTELIARTLDLRETARLQASRYVRGRTLGTKILAGKPAPGDEVVWLAP